MRRFLAVLILASSITVPALATDMASSWKPITYDQPTCMTRARAALATAAIAERVGQHADSVFGTAAGGTFLATVCCVAANHVAFIAVAGPDEAAATTYENHIRQAL